MSGYECLSSMDRFFVDVESDNAHMHVAAVMIFDSVPLMDVRGGVDVEKVRSYIASKLHLIPRYRQKLLRTPLTGQPVWVDDERLNLHYHVRHTALPRPGDLQQLKRLAARIHSQKLDRGKPLWELWLVEGLEGGRCALISKTHHCMIDGISGVDLMTVMFGTAPSDGGHEVLAWSPRPAPHGLRLLGDEIVRRATRPLELLKMGGSVMENPGGVCAAMSEAVSAVGQTLGAGVGGASATPFNRRIGGHRRFDWITLDLAQVKAAKRALGGTVNDVVLATVAGAMDRFLELRGIMSRRRREMDVRVFCPVSVRDPSERGTLGNRISGMIVPLPIGEAEPRARIDRIRQSTEQLKRSKQALGAEVLAAVSEWTVPTLLTIAARLAMRSRAYNLIVTNVPGPQIPLYFLRARLLEAFPLVPLFSNQALGIALFSYDGKLCWGLNADWDLLPDLHDFSGCLASAFQELLALVPATKTRDDSARDDSETLPRVLTNAHSARSQE